MFFMVSLYRYEAYVRDIIVCKWNQSYVAMQNSSCRSFEEIQIKFATYILLLYKISLKIKFSMGIFQIYNQWHYLGALKTRFHLTIQNNDCSCSACVSRWQDHMRRPLIASMSIKHVTSLFQFDIWTEAHSSSSHAPLYMRSPKQYAMIQHIIVISCKHKFRHAVPFW